MRCLVGVYLLGLDSQVFHANDSREVTHDDYLQWKLLDLPENAKGQVT